MKIIRDFGKALETMSKEIQGVPEEFYLGAGAAMLVLLILFFFAIPKTKFESEKKERYLKILYFWTCFDIWNRHFSCDSFYPGAL